MSDHEKDRGSSGDWGILSRISGLPAPWLLCVALALFVGLAVFAILGDSCTYDEAMHLSSGFTYATAGDFRMAPDNPPLAKTFAAIPLALTDTKWPLDTRAWKRGDRWEFSYRWLYQSGNDPDRILFLGRVFNLFWAVLLIISVYSVSKEHFGPKGGLISLVLASCSPTLLALGHLITTDMAVTTLMFLTVVSSWRFFRAPNLRWAVYTGLLMGGALACKYTALLLIPILFVLGCVCALKHLRKRATESAGPDSSQGFRRALLAKSGLLGVSLLLTYGAVWGAYGFRYAASPDSGFSYTDRTKSSEGMFLGRLTSLVIESGVLPEAYVYGLIEVRQYNSRGHAAYALGQYSHKGWPWYFPLVFLVKTPLPTLILFGWGIYAWVRRKGLEAERDIYLGIAFVIYCLFVICANINIGIRHILPIYPLVMVLAGGINISSEASRRAGRQRRALLVVLAGSVLACLVSAPYFIAHFNLPSRILCSRHRILADSNVDWGQDLGRLKAWMDSQGIPRIKLAYFGSASPTHVGLDHEIWLPSNRVTLYPRFERGWKNAESVLPGDYVAVSATLLADVYSHHVNDRYARFRDLDPIADIGHSIFVYRMPSRDP